LDNKIYGKAIKYLNSDVLKHLPTLKYLSLYRAYAEINLVEDSGDWAVMVSFPTSILSYDTATYPKARRAVFLNGISESLKHDLLATLTPDNYLLRLNEDLDLSRYSDRFAVSAGNVYISFSGSAIPNSSIEVTISPNPEIGSEAVELIAHNGYTSNDLAGYFGNGAQWFGLMANEHLASACFVYQNYGNIWEIAGVHTIETERKHGYATTVVCSALAFLLQRGLVPRYDTNQKNLISINLARRLGMKEFLTIKHFLLETR
jgi:hypothetical protein